MKDSRFSRRQFLTFGLLGAPLLLLADSFLVEPQSIKIRRFKLSSGRSSHRFIHFTDLHYKGDRNYVKAVVRKINSLSPDFVCFTGDLIEDGAFLAPALELLKEIRSPLYGVPGNHDYWAGVDFKMIASAFEATGGQWLENQNVLISDGKVNIIGSTCLKDPEVQLHSGLRNIMLIHYPAWVEQLAGYQFDITLAGHTHGGQVRFPFYGPIVLPYGAGKYDLGLFDTASGPLYVNAGIGYYYMNVRFNCPPELTVFEV